MKWTILALALLSSPARADWSCDGVLTSNNVCIGSESNVDGRNTHEPIETDRRDYIRPELNEDRDRDQNERDREHDKRRERQ